MKNNRRKKVRKFMKNKFCKFEVFSEWMWKIGGILGR